jgi:hypothetical protein
VKELEDYSWFPPVLRNFQLEYIGFVVTTFKLYDVFVNYINTLPLPVQSMTDLCSGSGEPAISIFRKCRCFSSLSLSDKYPNVSKLNDSRVPDGILRADVLAMEFKHGTYYTMFNAFHHFKDEEKLKIAQNIQISGSTAFIVEILEPTLWCLLKVVFMTTVGCLLLTPFIHPFSWKRLFFTYILPVNILTIAFDGIVSVLKSRSIKQYQTLFAHYGNKIKIVKLKNRLSSLVVIQIEPGK